MCNNDLKNNIRLITYENSAHLVFPQLCLFNEAIIPSPFSDTSVTGRHTHTLVLSPNCKFFWFFFSEQILATQTISETKRENETVWPNENLT